MIRWHEQAGLRRAVSIAFRMAVGLVVLVSALWMFNYLRSTRPMPARTEVGRVAIAVRTMEAEPREVRRVFDGHGTARAMRAVEVGAEVTARVVERPGRPSIEGVMEESESEALSIEPGVRISRGSLLIRLDRADFEQRAETAQRRIASLEADLEGLTAEEESLEEQLALAEEEVEIQEREFERTRRAIERGAGTDADLDVRLSSLRRAQREASSLRQGLRTLPSRRASLSAQLEGERVSLRLAERDIDRTEITSPLDGYVQRIDVDVGELVSAGSPVGRVVDPGVVEVPLRLPASAARFVREGDRVDLRPEGRGMEPVWTGIVARIAPEVDAQTRTLTVFAEVDQRDRLAAGEEGALLLPGQFVVGRVVTERRDERLMVPRRVVRDDHVMVLSREGAEGDRLVAREVGVVISHHEEGKRDDLVPGETQWSVLDGGLERGALVIISNLDEIRDGLRVRMQGMDGGATASGGEGAGESDGRGGGA